MKQLKRIILDPDILGGKPCIKGSRVTVGMIMGLLASGYIQEALAYAAWRTKELDVPLVTA